MQNNKDAIIELYFIKKLRVIDIAKQLEISKSAVTQVLQKDNRYLKEKELRKQQNRRKNIEYTKKYMANLRKSKEMEYARLKQAHIQATMELSGGNKPINNRAFRNWNSSAYRYDEKRKSYILKRGIIAGADVPKQIKWY